MFPPTDSNPTGIDEHQMTRVASSSELHSVSTIRGPPIIQQQNHNHDELALNPQEAAPLVVVTPTLLADIQVAVGPTVAPIVVVESSKTEASVTWCKNWCKKYFCEGQKLDDELSARHASTNGAQGIEKYRRQIGLVTPAIFVVTTWVAIMSVTDNFHLFVDSSAGVPGWYMTVMMFFGSMIAGMTSEGGASVAFPIMTLVFNIQPQIAVDFSLMIQSIGMTSATFSILFMRVQVEWTAIKFGTLGGIVGIIFGLEYVEPLLTPPFQKMYFVSIWFAFAVALFLLNRTLDRKVYWVIPQMNNWKRFALFVNGVIGGIFTSIAGSGIDICSFATLTLLFRVTEKSATPTSVVLMGINTCVGFLWRMVGMGGVHPVAWRYWACAVPIVTIGAPLGSVLGSHFHRLVLASFVYITDTTQLIGALGTVRPWETTSEPGKNDPVGLCVSSFLLMMCCWLIFYILTYKGLQMMTEIEEKKAQGTVIPTISNERATVKVVPISNVAVGAPRETDAVVPVPSTEMVAVVTMTEQPLADLASTKPIPEPGSVTV